MAHNLATINGQISMAYQGESPWHRLGNKLPQGADVPTAMAAAGLTWTVSTQPVYRQLDGQYLQITDRRAIIREDGHYLSTVGEGYKPIQNSEAFGTLQPACENEGIEIVTAGAIDEGRRVWMLARMPEAIEVRDGDSVNGYFLVTTGHDGMTAHTGRLTPVRVVCQNTLNAAMAADVADLIRIRHSASATDRVKEAQRLVTAMVKSLRATGETFRQLAARTMTPKEIAAYIESVIPADADGPLSDTTKQRRRDIGALVWCGVGAELAGSDANGTTAWGAYNAVTEYFDHVRPAQAKSGKGQMAANVSAIFGANAAAKARAFKVARQLAAV